jgi:flagellar hook-associated protein 1 FlgK
MATLTSSLGLSGNSLDVLTQALGVIQSNVSNSATPGYATQQLNLKDSANTGGGVVADGTSSSRDIYADNSVELQLQSLGLYTAQAQSTGTIQSFFDVTGNSGISTALTNLFTSFSSWATSPDVASTGQSVIAAAGSLATSISDLSTSLQQESSQIGQQASSTVDQINSLAAQIQQYNVAQMSGGQANAGADAQLQTNLESLANLVNFTALKQSDGTVTVLIGSGTPLVMGDEQFSLSASQSVTDQPPAANPLSPPTSHVYDSQGNDITSTLTGGTLGGLLDTQNRVLAGIIGDSQNQGSLNTLAQGIADTVNQVLESGTTSAANGSAPGTALFTYDNSDATHAAGSLAVASGITPQQLAPVDSSGNGNGNASALAALANPAAGAQGTVNGMSFTQYFASIAANVGQENSTATTNQQAQQQVTTQAQSLRDSISGVSLDAQAALLLQFQRAYQSVARVLTIVNSLADSIIDLVPQA